MKRLTDLMIRIALSKPRERRIDMWDGSVPGLMIRFGRTRGATWSLKLRVAGEGGVSKRGHALSGRRYRVTLGSYPKVTLEGARALANTYLDQAKRGISPIAALESAATARGMTVSALCEKFTADYMEMKQLRAARRYKTAMDVHIIPRLGNILADIVTREQVREFVKKTMVRVQRGAGARDRPRGGKEAARSSLAVLRKIFTWGITEGILKRKDNPASGMEANLPKKRQKDRVLSIEEARIAWRAAETLGYPFGPIFQLMMLTGCRPGEWGIACRSWIDFKQALAVIPAEAYKSDHVHVVPLVPQAVRILETVFAHHQGHRGDYIFSGTDGEKGVGGWSKGQARMLRAACAVSGERVLVPWTPHDLRRTVATRIAEQLGVGGEQMIRRVLGHSDGSVTAIYNRYGYVKEMRVVLERWANDLTGETMEPAHVVEESRLILPGRAGFAPELTQMPWRELRARRG